MKKEELKSLSNDDLRKRLNDLQAELFNLRFSLATGNLPNNSQIKNVKKDIARVKTILRERELKAEVAGN